MHSKHKRHINCIMEEFDVYKYHPTDCEKCSAYREYFISHFNQIVDSVMKEKIQEFFKGP